MMRAWIDLFENQQFIPQILYHGSRELFDEFDVGKNRTARHFYTSPDLRTASFYGPIVYRCEVKGPQANITHDGDLKLIRSLAEDFSSEGEAHVRDFDPNIVALRAAIIERLIASSPDPDYDETDAEFDIDDDTEYLEAVHKAATLYMADHITSGNLYEMNSRLQDSILEDVFDRGYRSIVFVDASTEGDPISVVARTSQDIRITGREK